MGGVPEVHLKMEFSRTNIAGKPSRLGRQRAGALNGCQIFGKHDPTLELAGAWIGCCGKIEGRAARPELALMITRRQVSLPGAWRVGTGGASAAKHTHELQAVGLRLQD
jgi:hypothetical protein